MSTSLIAYIAVVIVVGLGVTIRLLYWLSRTARLRRTRVQHRELFDALKSDVSTDTQAAQQKRALESIEQQSTVTRRLVVPLAILTTLAIVAVPFLASIPASLVSVVVAAITIIVGIAVRPIVENAFAGLVISSSRLVNIGDTVRMDEAYGIIEDITFTHTTVKLWDWRRLVVPNTQMLQKTFLNYSLHDTYLWAYAEVWVAPDADLDRVRELAMGAARKSKHFADYEDPRFWVMEMTRDATLCWVAAWADTPADGWLLTADIRSELLKSFRAEGIACQLARVDLRNVS